MNLPMAPTLAEAEQVQEHLSPADLAALKEEVREVQDVADYVGDSLGLSRQAAATDAEVIAFCGVHFMAETASILCPQKTVLIPDLDAGCSLAASIDAEQLAEWRARYPRRGGGGGGHTAGAGGGGA